MTRPPTSPAATSGDAHVARPRCPRCGASLGRLAADASAPDDGLYCGCCGLVLPAATPATPATPPGSSA